MKKETIEEIIQEKLSNTQIRIAFYYLLGCCLSISKDKNYEMGEAIKRTINYAKSHKLTKP